MDFYLYFHVSEGVPVRKKHEVLDQGRDSLYFQVFPWHFYFVRGHSFVELTGHDTVLISWYIVCTYTAAFLVHHVYR